MMFKRELIDELVSGRDAKDIFERNGLLDKLREALAARLSEPAAVERSDNVMHLPTSRRPASIGQTLRDDAFEAELNDADLPAQYRLRFPDFEDQVALLFGRGLGVRDIKRRLEALYGVAVPDELLVAHAHGVEREAHDWLQRALEPLYPIIVFDALRVKVRSNSAGRNKICHLALGLHPSGAKEILGLWIFEQSDLGAWDAILKDLKRRGVEDVLIFVNGDDAFRHAAEQNYPRSQSLTRIVELLRETLSFASSQCRATVAAALRDVYCAPDSVQGRQQLEVFIEGPVAAKHPAIAPLWKRSWHDVVPFFALPVEVRRIIASTFAMDVLQRNLKRALRLRGQVDSDDDAMALLFLVVRKGQSNWKRPQREWHAAKALLAITFPDRFSAR